MILEQMAVKCWEVEKQVRYSVIYLKLLKLFHYHIMQAAVESNTKAVMFDNPSRAELS